MSVRLHLQHEDQRLQYSLKYRKVAHKKDTGRVIFYRDGNDLVFHGMEVAFQERGKGFSLPLLKTFSEFSLQQGYQLRTTKQRKPLVNRQLTALGLKPDSQDAMAFIQRRREGSSTRVYLSGFQMTKDILLSQNISLLDAKPDDCVAVAMNTTFSQPPTAELREQLKVLPGIYTPV
ncbi:hypothetical protein [Sansalvadorimonas verongulae]|uniref:hypothetical protein n=1 Tax=Sansalvadorimonas verongulae TaxID=2172824 RepID=UPI0012BC5350|nr:hypothetical protein [Sansalvadorimonas verongulae]MTI11917.1 hypothetical protein [Sansalvadorimonas verongulae]